MAGPREFTPEREETPMTDVEAAFERLIECLEEYSESLTDDQYKRLQEHLPSNLTTEELGYAVGKLVGTNCVMGEFGDTLTNAFKEAILTSPEYLTKPQLVSISELLPAGSADGVLEDADYRFSVGIITQYYEGVGKLHNDKKVISGLITEMVSSVLVNLDAGLTMESLEKFCEHYDGADVVIPTVNHREKGTLVDGSEDVTIRIPFTMPKRLNDLSDDIMEIADKLATLGYTVESRVWDHLLVYVPQHSQLKKRLKKIEKATGMHDLRKQIKNLVG